MSKKLYVNNLSSETTESELREVFAGVGGITSVRIVLHPKTGLSRNYGFVEMETPELAETAAQRLNSFVLHDRKLQVSVVLPREQRKTPPSADLTRVELRQPSRRTGGPRSR